MYCVCKNIFGRTDKTKNKTDNIKTSGFSFQERCISVMQKQIHKKRNSKRGLLKALNSKSIDLVMTMKKKKHSVNVLVLAIQFLMK